jgi:hypothetical protein
MGVGFLEGVVSGAKLRALGFSSYMPR